MKIQEPTLALKPRAYAQTSTQKEIIDLTNTEESTLDQYAIVLKSTSRAKCPKMEI